MQESVYRNPVISGFNPDPSVCRAGDDYYLVTSTFEFFPGVPVYHSKNLVNWELIGHCLTRESQLPLSKCRPSRGIWAPTIRYHNGMFYMTTSCMSDRDGRLCSDNIICHSRYPDHGWSEPVHVRQPKPDSSLFFDDDGRVYFTSGGCLLCEIDPMTGEMLSETERISSGCGGRCPEATHIYKIRGKYYLVMAEGGTEYTHTVTIQRADSPRGPYEPCPYNPIVSNVHKRPDDISCTGHADLIEDTNGNWWLFCLGVRPCGAGTWVHNLGRETFLAPLVWDKDGWPHVGTDGTIAAEMKGPLPAPPEPVCRDFTDDFSVSGFPPEYNFLRNPDMKNYFRISEKSTMRLRGTGITLNEQDSPTWIGIRQKGFDTVTTLEMSPAGFCEEMRIGVTAFYNHDYHYDLYLTRESGRWKVCVAKHIHDIFAVTAQLFVSLPENGRMFLQILSDKIRYTFRFSTDGINYTTLDTGVTVGLSSESTMMMTFTGTYLAMFAEHAAMDVRSFDVKVLDS